MHSLVTRRFVCTLCSWYHPSWVNSFRKIDLASRANGELGKLWPFRELRRIHASSRWRCLLRPSCNYEEEGVFFLRAKKIHRTGHQSAKEGQIGELPQQLGPSGQDPPAWIKKVTTTKLYIEIPQHLHLLSITSSKTKHRRQSSTLL